MQKDVGNLLQSIDKKLSEDDAELNVILTNNLRYIPRNEFSILFADALFVYTEPALKEKKMSMTDLRVILRIVHYTKYGNLVQISRQTLMEDCGLKPAHLSRSLKKLHELGLLLTVNRNMYLNPQVIAKGSLRSFAEAKKIEGFEQNLIEMGAKQLEKFNIEPNIETQKMKEKRQKIIRNSLLSDEEPSIEYGDPVMDLEEPDTI